MKMVLEGSDKDNERQVLGPRASLVGAFVSVCGRKLKEVSHQIPELLERDFD